MNSNQNTAPVEQPRTRWVSDIDWTKEPVFSVHKGIAFERGPLEEALPHVRALAVSDCLLLPASTGMVDRLRKETGFELVRKTVSKSPKLMLIMRTR